MALAVEVLQAEDIPTLFDWNIMGFLQMGCVTTWQQRWSRERMEE